MVLTYRESTYVDPVWKDGKTAGRIGDILVNDGYISEKQLARALEYQELNGGKLGWICTTLGYINRLGLCKALAEAFPASILS